MVGYKSLKVFSEIGASVCEDVTKSFNDDYVRLSTDSIEVTEKRRVSGRYPSLYSVKTFYGTQRIAIDNKKWKEFLKGKKGNVHISCEMSHIHVTCGCITATFPKKEDNTRYLDAHYDAKELAMLVADCEDIYIEKNDEKNFRPIRSVNKDGVILAICAKVKK
jgi:hypothetical protein